MRPAASEEDLRSLPPAVQRKVRAVFRSCYLPIGLSFLCRPQLPWSTGHLIPLAGGDVQRIVDSRFDSVELGTLARRYEALLCSELPPSSIIPIFFWFSFVLPAWSPLGNQRRCRFFLLAEGNGSTGWTPDCGRFSILHRRGRTARHGPSHHGSLDDGCSWLDFPPPEPLGWRPPFKPHHPRYQLMAPKPTGPPKLPSLHCAFTSVLSLSHSSLFESLPMFGARLTRPHLPILLNSPLPNTRWSGISTSCPP